MKGIPAAADFTADQKIRLLFGSGQGEEQTQRELLLPVSSQRASKSANRGRPESAGVVIGVVAGVVAGAVADAVAGAVAGVVAATANRKLLRNGRDIGRKRRNREGST